MAASMAALYTLEQLSEELSINYSSLKKQADRLNDKGEMLNRYGKTDEVQPDDMEALLLSYANRVENAARLAKDIGLDVEPSPSRAEVSVKQAPTVQVNSTPEKPKRTKRKNPGEAISGNKIFKFISAVVFIGAQGWIFADLASRVLPQIQGVPMAAEFVVGFLFEATAIMIALNLPADKMIFGDLPIRNLWLGIFFPVQILTVFCWAQIFGPELSDGIGKVVVALSVPIGILAYSNLYFKDKK